MADIVVYGKRYGSIDGAIFYSRSLEEYPPDMQPTLYPDGAGGGEVSFFTIVPYLGRCPTKDAAAKHVSDKIATIPNQNSVEYGAPLIQSGSIFRTPLDQVTSTGLPRGGDVGIRSDLMPQLQGSVHTHRNNAPNANPLRDRYSSDADWAMVDKLVVSGAQYGFNPASYSLYISDHEGNVRRFDYSARSTYPNDAQTEQRDTSLNLPPVITGTSGCTG